MFIYSPHYTAKKKNVHILINFISLATGKTRKNRVRGQGSEDVALMLTGPLAARLRVEFGFYWLIKSNRDFSKDQG